MPQRVSAPFAKWRVDGPARIDATRSSDKSMGHLPCNKMRWCPPARINPCKRKAHPRPWQPRLKILPALLCGATSRRRGVRVNDMSPKLPGPYASRRAGGASMRCKRLLSHCVQPGTETRCPSTPLISDPGISGGNHCGMQRRGQEGQFCSLCVSLAFDEVLAMWLAGHTRYEKRDTARLPPPFPRLITVSLRENLSE